MQVAPSHIIEVHLKVALQFNPAFPEALETPVRTRPGRPYTGL